MAVGMIRKCLKCGRDYDSGVYRLFCPWCYASLRTGVLPESHPSVRPGWDAIWMEFAARLSQRSTCSRLSVGCVVVSDDNSVVLGLGYNGGAKGLSNQCLSLEPGKCFSGGVQITTREGLKRIKNIREGDFVLTHLNRYRRVSRVIRSETATRDFALVKFNGGRNGRFIATAEHPVYVKRAGELMWVPARSILLTDLIVSAAHLCRDCGKDIPQKRELCLVCFKTSSKTRAITDRYSKRMKTNNPMRGLAIVVSRPDTERSARYAANQSRGLLALRGKLAQYARDLELKMGGKAIVVDHIDCKPDIVWIDWDNHRVVAHEYERHQRNVKLNKYDGDVQYDDVVWHVENTQQDTYERISDGFVGLAPKSIEIVQRTCPVYNLEVEEDHTYVCQGVSVHNCGHLHAEINALIKANFRDAATKKAYITSAPCYPCSVALVNANIRKVVYRDAYRDQSGLALLSQAGVQVRQFPPPGVPERYLQVDEDREP